MQSNLSAEFRDTPDGSRAEAILRRCVHCGFCTATCPTYQLLGNELDSPRGRIYLIKQILEGEPVTHTTQQHLDRCLTCRACETTCPSGVEYAALLDIGRRVVAGRIERPPLERLLRVALRELLDSPVFPAALAAGRALRPLLPARIRQKVPAPARKRTWQPRELPRKVLLPAGCVQPAMAPGIDAATRRVLDTAGIQAITAPRAGCCGAIRLHLADRPGAQANARAYIDAWWSYVESGQVEAIVSNASGCGVTIKEYADLFPNGEYTHKARRVAELARDLSELLPDIVAAVRSQLDPARLPALVLHVPCTLQHGQKLGDQLLPALCELGFRVRMAESDDHLCCGSAGTHVLLQPDLATRLRDRKLAALEPAPDEVIVSANIGCIHHLQTGTPVPVRHWVEVLDEALDFSGRA